ncbi:MAG TPA: phosphoribosylanthranilate isomerase [Spirochaetota bacterium]|jgi:phosphoribosylanthranilate isomerase|nr:phosphoribosylanthranilate isomerase [Spirochaetota bacterium]OQA97753.1 MAG: N-(5'-phosphoribosyl)anthranilate isomerase [Spirochaetes bacterium ADurb.Bin218]HOK93023.1 phosphoribosylanthranilate isomerase [Spirochaetota bacterium]HON15648.1 phosphoribosylanthranilate isomerase [Spirochaetota bacterium]HOQ12303.1 phosphoribosylanthranilate isomerase [Spirochaetota bacterium]
MFVKLCGFTQEEDVKFVADLPVSAIGFIFYKKSLRYVSAEKARELGNIAGSSLLKVGVFVDNTVDEIKAIAERASLDMLQLYNIETARALQGFLPIIQCFRIKDSGFEERIDSEADFILVDTFDQQSFGGTGKTFDLALLNNCTFKKNLIIAGGINPENVSSIISKIKPFGIDLSSGIEISPGVKSREKIIQLLLKIKEAENDSIT